MPDGIKLPVELVNKLIKCAGKAPFEEVAPVVQEVMRIAQEQGVGAPPQQQSNGMNLADERQ